MEKEILWHKLSVPRVLEKLKTSFEGLTKQEAQNRLKTFGFNVITKKRASSALKIFLSQFTNFLIIILILAMVIAFLAEKITTGLVVFFTIILNIILGFVMEHRAEKSVAALKKMLVRFVRVIRNNKEQKIETSLLVPGDIIILEEGMKIPADCHILEAVNLEVNEASLTGESMPVAKKTELEKDNEDEKIDMVFMGTTIIKGYGKAVVVETGIRTAFGKIAEMLGEIKEPVSPLQKQITILGKRIAVIAFLIAAFILIFGVIGAEDIWLAIAYQAMVALSLFVAVIPQGLLLVLTLALSLGAHRMARRKAVIKRLNTVETLGCTQVICTDKTGTLTKNEMKVQKIWTGGKEFEVGEREFDLGLSSEIPVLLKIGVLSNTAEVLSKENGFEILGDPTEASLLVLAEKAGLKKRELKSRGELIAEFSFDQTLKRRTVAWKENSLVEIFTVGAPETVLEISNKILKQGQEKHLCPKEQQEIIQTFESLASQGYRMIALAYKKVPETALLDFVSGERDEITQRSMEKNAKRSSTREKLEKDLVFVGLAAIYDPPRPEARQAIKMCQEAGIRVVMITGDNKLTALAIAKEVGLVDSIESSKVITGKELDQMSEAEFSRIINKINVFARTTPAHKLKIVEMLQKQEKVVAVTGDGVNDAPALKEADIGIAMGITGTDVAKEASKMIITDDNFATIVKATKEGRTIFDNIKKFTQFLLSANAIETPLIIAALFLGWPLPLHPLHILWINLVTDSVPAVTLSTEPACKGIMKRKPRPFKETIFKGIISPILIIGGLGFLMALAIFAWIYFIEEGGLVRAQTMAFTFIVLFKLFFVFSCRSFRETIFKIGFLTNKKMILAVLFSMGLQLIVVHISLMQTFFKTTSLNYLDWLILLPLALSGLIVMEIKKIIIK